MIPRATAQHQMFKIQPRYEGLRLCRPLLERFLVAFVANGTGNAGCIRVRYRTGTTQVSNASSQVSETSRDLSRR